MGSGMAQGNRMKVCAPIAEAFRGGHRCGNPVEPSNRRGLMAECRPILGIDRLHAFALGFGSCGVDHARPSARIRARRQGVNVPVRLNSDRSKSGWANRLRTEGVVMRALS